MAEKPAVAVAEKTTATSQPAGKPAQTEKAIERPATGQQAAKAPEVGDHLSSEEIRRQLQRQQEQIDRLRVLSEKQNQLLEKLLHAPAAAPEPKSAHISEPEKDEVKPVARTEPTAEPKQAVAAQPAVATPAATHLVGPQHSVVAPASKPAAAPAAAKDDMQTKLADLTGEWMQG